METSLRDQLATHLEHYFRERAERQACSLSSKGESGLMSSCYSKISYGTAGFRGKATEVEPLFYNVGLIASLRSIQFNGANIGVMITASHNPIQDNGVKLIDPTGEMLDSKWEPIVERFCNTHDIASILKQLDELSDTSMMANNEGRVMIGMDTRPSSEALANLVKQGIQAFGGRIKIVDYSHVTTPILHYLVAESNKTCLTDNTSVGLPVERYYKQLVSGLANIFNHDPERSLSRYSADQLIVDCANGVGYESMRNLCNDPNFVKYLPVQLINIGDGILNKFCGADHVKTTLTPPQGATCTNKRYAALDGDADRLVYFYLESEEVKLRLKLLDGDKIMALFALYFKEALEEANLDSAVSLGVVQTAYANGASTDYMAGKLGLKVDCVDTGVKNLHRQAVNYDVGIYFEANGHGSIWLSERLKTLINDNDNNKESLANLKRLLKVINNYTGDAISDLLVVEVILRHYDWNIEQWYNLYKDRPNSLIKIEVRDRDVIQTTNAARTCVQPEGLQEAIDGIVKKFGPEARCFVRPSGTENVVRIYAEASDEISAKSLAKEVADEVGRRCNA